MGEQSRKQTFAEWEAKFDADTARLQEELEIKFTKQKAERDARLAAEQQNLRALSIKSEDEARSPALSVSEESESGQIQPPKPTFTPPAPGSVVPVKRPATSSAFADERRPALGLSDLGKIRKRNPKTSPQTRQSPQSPAVGEQGDVPLTLEIRPPKWYLDTRTSNTRGKNQSNVDLSLQTLKADIRKAKALDRKDDRLFSKIRDQLHVVAFLKVNATLLKTNRMMHNEDGLPQIFDAKYAAGVDWPWDVKADAEELYIRWAQEIFDYDLLRGIILGRPGANSQQISADFKGGVSAKYHGNGSLLNGQWWPTQLCLVRDGAHGQSIKGISGGTGQGAWSCVISGGRDPTGQEYPNEDHGEVVLYCGTDSDNYEPSTDTTRLLESETNQKPVRLIRSHNVGGEFAPKMGFRYDGLYRVTSHELLDPPSSKRQRHRFRMERLPGQPPIRGGEGPERRPTNQEMYAHKMDRERRGYKN